MLVVEVKIELPGSIDDYKHIATVRIIASDSTHLNEQILDLERRFEVINVQEI